MEESTISKDKDFIRIILFILSVIVFVLLGLFGVLSLSSVDDITITRQDLLKGVVTSKLQSAFDHAVPIRDFSVNFWAKLRYGIFNQGCEGVLIGKNGWLFTTEEYDSSHDFAMKRTEALELISDVNAQLNARGVSLVVLPLPSKSRVYQDFADYPYSTALSCRYSGFLSDLTKRGITHVDLLSAFMAERESSAEEKVEGNTEEFELFFHTDTHWTPLGARVASRELIPVIMPFLEAAFISPRTFASEVVCREILTGDLMSYLPEDDSLFRNLPSPEELVQYETLELNPPKTGLFDIPKIPVILVGTSYSADERWNFEGFLKESLRADVVNIAETGKGPFEPMNALLEEDIIEEISSSVVIWEIPERYILY